MPMPSHLILEGKNQGAIEGSCDIEGREGTILVQALDHSVVIPRDPQTGLPTGKRIHCPFTVTKEFGPDSPKLYQALASGEQFSNVQLDFYRITAEGTEEHYFTIKLEDAILVELEAFYPNAMDPSTEYMRHMERVSWTYSKITWSHVADSIESEDAWQTPK